MYFCICCNQYHDEFDMVMWQCKPYPNRFGFCHKCFEKTTFEERRIIENGGEQLNFF